jgi:TetR/AcrR family transcriptional repressor of nem operon
MTDRSLYLHIIYSEAMDKAKQTRQFIIEQAAPVFNTKGIAATAMSDVMAVTKLSKGSLYVHFKDKEELSHAVVDYNIQLLRKQVLAAVTAQKDARSALYAFLDIFADPLHPPVQGGCPLLNFCMEADDNYPEIRQKVNQELVAAQHIISGIIKQGITEGIFVRNWNAGQFATKMFAMIEGGVLLCRAAGNSSKMKVIQKIIKKEIEDHRV